MAHISCDLNCYGHKIFQFKKITTDKGVLITQARRLLFLLFINSQLQKDYRRCPLKISPPPKLFCWMEETNQLKELCKYFVHGEKLQNLILF